MGSEEVTLLISFCIFCQLCFSKHPLLYHSPFTIHAQTCSAQADTHTPTKTHLYTNPLEPPERSDQGVSPPNTSSPPHLFCSAIAFCQSQQQNGGSRKKMGRKKKGKKEYRLAFRAPRGPLSSIRNERAAKHQPCFFSLSLPLPLSLQGPLSMKRAI